jgi:hypothetical protein
MTKRHGLMAGAFLLLAALAAGCGPGERARRREPREGTPRAGKGDSDRRDKPRDIAVRPDDRGKSITKPKDKLATPPNPQVTRTEEGGIIRGRALWKGPVPTPRLVVGSESGGVSDVVVWLEKPPANTPPPAADTLSLVQAKGRLRLRVQAAGAGARVQVAAVGSTLQLGTTDDQADLVVSGAARFARLLRRGEKASVPLARRGWVEVRSDEKPGMAPAYVRVLDHPYHAITGSDGRFRLPMVPPGEYRVRLWHESWLGEPGGVSLGRADKPVQLTVPVKLAAGQGARLVWTVSSWHPELPARDPTKPMARD